MSVLLPPAAERRLCVEGSGRKKLQNGDCELYTERERKHPCRHTEQSRRIARRFIRRFSPSISLINNLTFVLIKMGRFRPNGFSRRLGVTLQQPAPNPTYNSLHTYTWSVTRPFKSSTECSQHLPLSTLTKVHLKRDYINQQLPAGIQIQPIRD